MGNLGCWCHRYRSTRPQIRLSPACRAGVWVAGWVRRWSNSHHRPQGIAVMTTSRPTDVGHVRAGVATKDATTSYSQHRNEGDADRLAYAMHVATEAVRAVGSDHIEIVTLTRGRICRQPVNLNH